MRPIRSKLPNVQTTIFTVMSKLAADAGAINMSQGFPDFECPARLLERVTYYLTRGFNQYAPMAGVPELRTAIARKVGNLYGARVDPETEITVTSGATEAIFASVTAVVGPGDEAILLDPAYDAYEPAVSLNGGIARRIPLTPGSFKVDWDRVRDGLNERTRLLVVNTPHNPTGAAWDFDDIQALREIVADHDVYLLSDEVYEHMVFDGMAHPSLLRYPDLYDRAFVVSSFGKTYHVTGWKIAYCVAPPLLSAELRRIHQFLTFATSTPMQLAIADFLDDCPEHHLGLAAFYQAKRDLFCGLLAGSRFGLTKAAGTYFQLLDYSDISDEPDVDLARRLTIEHGLASIPISVFYERPPPQSLLRFCFAKDDETLTRAAEILCRL